LTQESEELNPNQPKNEFVNWNSLNPLLNKELQNEESNFFVYTDQSSAEEDSGSEDSFSD